LDQGGVCGRKVKRKENEEWLWDWEGNICGTVKRKEKGTLNLALPFFCFEKKGITRSASFRQ
jgi:hypothetical protein